LVKYDKTPSVARTIRNVKPIKAHFNSEQLLASLAYLGEFVVHFSGKGKINHFNPFCQRSEQKASKLALT
jgi:hypothetical protein